jgi:asparagine synthase (glutamine-hydrolysing)
MVNAEKTWIAAFRVEDTRCAGPLDGLAATAGVALLFLLQEHPRAVLADTGNVRAIIDGSLYDRMKLRELLGCPGEEVSSDAALLARAYECWGADALHRLQGSFVAIIWDKRHERLLCVRDPLGMCPLFYAMTGGVLLVSTTIESLLAQPGVSRDFNRPRLVEQLARRLSRPAETCYASVSRIPPGHLLEVDAHGIRARRYWDPLPADRPIDWVNDEDAQELFETALHRAVERQLNGGSVGVLLSGGIDSSTVAVVAADLCASRSFPPPWAVSLTLLQRRDAETLGTEIAADLAMPRLRMPYESAFGSNGLLASGVELASRLPGPLYNALTPAFLPLLNLSREKGCTVMLTGEGADEWLGMSPEPAANLLRPTDLIGLFRLSRALSQSYQNVRWAGMKGVFWHHWAKPPIRRAWRRASSYVRGRPGRGARLGNPPRADRHWIPPEPWIAADPSLREQLRERGCHEVYGADRSNGPEDAYRRIKRAALDAATQGLRSEEAFRLGQISGVAVRDPFLDPDLVALLARIRPRAKARGGVAKALPRNLLASRFPSRGFEVQRKSTARAEYLRALAQSESVRAACALPGRWVLEEIGVIDARQAARFLERPPDGMGWRVWDLVNLEAWVRTHR